MFEPISKKARISAYRTDGRANAAAGYSGFADVCFAQADLLEWEIAQAEIKAAKALAKANGEESNNATQHDGKGNTRPLPVKGIANGNSIQRNTIQRNGASQHNSGGNAVRGSIRIGNSHSANGLAGRAPLVSNGRKGDARVSAVAR